MSTTLLHPDEPRRGQFGLKGLFAAITLAGALFGFFHWTGPYGAVILVGLAAGAVLRYAVHRPLAIAGALVGLFLTMALLPACQDARTPARRSQCNNNLKQIGLGLQTYADSHLFFPADFASYGGEPADDEMTPGE
ncbi:MAG TPA: DUF1559 domain-containing protein [Pirellulales bacterium]|nr:DUF1559 domain-containing protein [Pirellulales bacterium]